MNRERAALSPLLEALSATVLALGHAQTRNSDLEQALRADRAELSLLRSLDVYAAPRQAELARYRAASGPMGASLGQSELFISASGGRPLSNSFRISVEKVPMPTGNSTSSTTRPARTPIAFRLFPSPYPLAEDGD